jgi:hypothetical protein
VAAPTIDSQPQPQTVAIGDRARFAVKATGDNLTYEWFRGETAIPNEASAELTFIVSAADNGISYKVKVKSGSDVRVSDPAVLTVVAEAPPTYDPQFAVGSAIGLLVAFALVLWPIWLIAGKLLTSDSDATRVFPGVVATQLVIAGVFIAVAALYVALLEFRGRASREILTPAKPKPRVDGQPGDLGLADEAIKVAPELIKQFGQLKVPASLMVVASVALIGASAIAWRALPDPSAEATPSPSAEVTPAPDAGVTPPPVTPAPVTPEPATN